MEGVYFSAANAFLVSMPIQIFSFFVWRRHKTDKTKSELIKMKWWQLILSVVAIFPAWAGCYFGISGFLGGTEPLLDSLTFVLGILISMLIAFRYIEGQYFNVISCIIALAMWISICIKSPNNVNFLIIAFCVFLMVRLLAKLNKKKEEPKVEPAPPAPSNEEVLLTEIRDLLKEKK
jgi:large conductance mechanosensitive channel protein